MTTPLSHFRQGAPMTTCNTSPAPAVRFLSFGTATALLCFSLSGSPAIAQSTPDGSTRHGPLTLERTDIALAGADQVMAAAFTEAQRNGWKMSVAVVDSSGELVAFRKADGASAISVQVAIAKARTAALIQQPSKHFEDYINNGRPSFLSTPGVTPLEGGIPLRIADQVIGARLPWP
ncbi:GlcG/HbpS family heme-binding protein [Lampropedia hyalina]